MARTGKATGTIIVAESGQLAELSIGFSPESGAITAHTTGKKIQAASTTVTLALGGVAAVGFLYLKATDNVTGAKVGIQVNLNAVGALPATDEMLMTSQTNAITTKIGRAHV